MNKYFKQYKLRDMREMLKNQKKHPDKCSDRFDNKLLVITGATSGIGYETAKMFAQQGANILSINRSEEKSIALSNELENEFGINASFLIADFTSLDDVHRVGRSLSNLEEEIDVLIHNAGVYLTKKEFTIDGMEKVFQTNYLSSFIINNYVLDKFRSQDNGRIIYVNSEAHRFAAWGLHLSDLSWEKHSYSGLKSYGAAKLAQLLSILKFSEILEDSNVNINAMHPGNVKTNSGSSNGKLYKWFKRKVIDKRARGIEISADALYYLGASEQVKDISGKFFNLTTIEKPAPPALDLDEAEKLWQLSVKLGGLE